MKNTKKALLLSVMSLVLCVSMLVGTTFAWFTDSVSTGKNVIAAGNLDVVLSYKLDKDAEWAEVTTETELFDDAALWEPGYTQVVYLKVANAGSLALKYQLGLNIISETQGKNVDGDMFSLSDYIEFDAIETDAENFYADRDAARKAVTDSKIISAGYSKASELEKTGDTEYVALVVYMPETVGNGANYRDIQPKITLGLNLVATQKTYEKDSFDELYDENATYIPAWDGETVTPVAVSADGYYHINNGAELAYINTILTGTQVETGIKVMLDADINLGNHAWAPIGLTTFASGEGRRFEGVFEGNGHTIYNLNVESTNANVGLFGVTVKATISNLKISGATVSGSERIGALVGYANSGSQIINCSVEDVAVSGDSKVGGIVGDLVSSTLTKSSAADATVLGDEKVGGLIGRVREDGVASSVTNNIVFDSVIYGQTDVDALVGYNMSGADLSTNTAVNVQVQGQGTLVAPGVVEVGTRSYEVTGKEGLLNVNAIIASSSTGEGVGLKVKLLADVDLAGEIWKPIDQMWVDFDGNGHTISNLTTDAWKAGFFGYLGGGSIKNLTLENVNVTGAQAGAFAGAIEGTIDNCVLKGDNTITWAEKHQYDDPNAGIEAWSGIGAITGVAQPCTINATIAEGATVKLNYGAITTEAPYVDQFTGYIGTNKGTVVNNGTIIVVASDTASLIAAIKNAPEGQVTTIQLASGTYAGDIDITRAAMGQQGGDVVIKAMEGAKPVLTGTTTMGYYEKRVGAEKWNATVSFEGITFDHAQAAAHSIDVQDVKAVHLKDCTIIGDGEFGIGSSAGNSTGASSIVDCTFENAGMQILGNFGGVSAAEPLIIKGCTFDESVINVQGGHAVTVEGCTFKNTVTDAHNGESFYVIRTQAIPMNISKCEFNVDSTVTGVGVAGSKGWGVFVNRNTANWTVDDIKVNMTDAALVQEALKIAECLSTGKINMTNWKLNGVEQ